MEVEWTGGPVDRRQSIISLSVKAYGPLIYVDIQKMTTFSFKNFVHKNCHYFGVGDSQKLDGFYTCCSELDLDILGFRLSDGLLQYLLIVFELPVARPTLFRPEVLSVIL